MKHSILVGSLAFAIVGCAVSIAKAENVTRTPAMNCNDWKRIGLHTWTQTGVIKQNGFTWSGNTLDNTDLTRMMDMLCTGGANDHVY